VLSPPRRYLHQPVLGPQPRSGGWRVGVDRADELPRPGLLAVQVEAVATGAFLQVAETGAQLLLTIQILRNGEGVGGRQKYLIFRFGFALRQMQL